MFNPIQDRVVIKEEDYLSKTKSGIILTSGSNDNRVNKSGEVIAVGSLVEYVKPGDKVLFTGFNPNMVEYNNETFYIMREPDILATIKDEDDAE